MKCEKCDSPVRLIVVDKDDPSTVEVLKVTLNGTKRVTAWSGRVQHDTLCYYHAKVRDGFFNVKCHSDTIRQRHTLPTLKV